MTSVGKTANFSLELGPGADQTSGPDQQIGPESDQNFIEFFITGYFEPKPSSRTKSQTLQNKISKNLCPSDSPRLKMVSKRS